MYLKNRDIMESKQIIALSDFEHVLQRSTMYVGSIEPSDEKLMLIENSKIVTKTKNISIGLYKLFYEILDNAFDEAKRCNGKMKKIIVEVFSKSKRVIIIDTGNGFYKGYEKNEKTKVSNVETAMSSLRAGSNFKNDNTKENLIGTNGVGASIVNMLSDEFEITTCDGKKTMTITWNKFKRIRNLLKDGKTKGTRIDFTPREDMFNDCTWDKDILFSQLVFRNFIKNNDPLINNLEIVFKFDGEILNLNVPFIDDPDVIEIDSKIGKIYIWRAFNNSDRVSFVNGTQCTGIHQRIIQEWLNDFLKYDKGHEFYETFIFLNLEPNLVLFDSQNKTNFKTSRLKINPILDKAFKAKLKKEFINSELYNKIKIDIDLKINGNSKKEIAKISKQKKIQISEKYYPAAKRKDMIFLTEGLSASGSLLQRRDSETMGVYALKGKIKNTKNIKDLTTNSEIAEIVQIIGLDFDAMRPTKYENIIIATDSDVDGAHISSLILNFLYKWFPHVIKSGKVFKLETPLITAKYGNTLERFYTLNEFNEKSKKRKYNNIRYLKGLGSLSIEDWDYTFKNLRLVRFTIDNSAKKNFEMAFDENSEKRKIWLTGEVL